MRKLPNPNYAESLFPLQFSSTQITRSRKQLALNTFKPFRAFEKNGDTTVEDWSDSMAGDFEDLSFIYAGSNNSVNSIMVTKR